MIEQKFDFEFVMEVDLFNLGIPEPKNGFYFQRINVCGQLLQRLNQKPILIQFAPNKMYFGPREVILNNNNNNNENKVNIQ